jgi:hypothetical protein
MIAEIIIDILIINEDEDINRLMIGYHLQIYN